MGKDRKQEGKILEEEEEKRQAFVEDERREILKRARQEMRRLNLMVEENDNLRGYRQDRA